MRWKPTRRVDRGRRGVAQGAGPTERFRAVLASRSRGQLIASLDDPSPSVASAAARRLAEIEGRRAGPVLCDQLLHSDLSTVPDIARVLRKLGDRQAVDIAIAGLGDQHYTHRLAAAIAVGELRDPSAAWALCEALADEIAGVRVAALNALVQVSAPVGTAARCARLLADSNPQVRVAAVRAVARLAPRPGEWLTSVGADPDRRVRLEVARHAAALPAPAASWLLADVDLRVREAAARAVGPREMGILAVLLVDDPADAVRKAAARTLGRFDDAGIADVLAQGLEDPDAVVRAAVVRSLERRLTRRGAIERLAQELGSDRPARRRMTLYALARLHAREASPRLAPLLDDPDADVRLAVVHTAHALLDDPEPAMRYLMTDGASEVRHAAEVWLLRRRETGAKHPDRPGGDVA